MQMSEKSNWMGKARIYFMELYSSKIKFFILAIRLSVLVFLILNFHVFNKQPIFELNLINIIELLYLIYILVLFVFSNYTPSFKTQISKLIFDFLFITIFWYKSLLFYDSHSWLYVLYLIPIIFCSFWFNWIITIIFVTIVSVSYATLNYFILDLGNVFKTSFKIIRTLAPGVMIFYIVALGSIFYKRRIPKSYEEIEKETKDRTVELREDKEYTRKLLKSSFDAIIAVDKDGYISEVNERTCELFEYDREEMVNKKVKKFYARGEGNRIMNELRNRLDGSIENFDAFILSKRKEKIPILLSVAFLYDKSLDLKKELEKGRKFPTVGYFRDKRAEKAIDDIAKGITSTIDEKELFTKIAENVTKILKAEACSILTYNEGKGLFKVINSYGMPEPLKSVEPFESYDEKDSMIAQTFFSKRPLNISNIDVHKEQPRHVQIKWKYAQNFAKNSKFGDLKHFLGVPLEVQGKVYGVIRVINKYTSNGKLDKEGFIEKDIKLLERISNQVSILVEKVRDKGRFRAISEVGKKLNEMYDVPLSDLLETIAREVVKGMRFKACYLRLIEEGNILKITAYYGLKGNYTNNEKYNLKIGVGISGDVVKSGEYRKIEDLLKVEEFEFKEILETEELRSMLSVPLKYRNRVIGVINCYTRRVHKFTEQEIQIVSTFAAYASTAIQNKKRVEELVYALNEVGSELVKPVKIEELFLLILKKAKALSGADSLCIKTYDERSGIIKTVKALNCKWHEKYNLFSFKIWEGLEGSIIGKVIESGQSKIISNDEEMRERLKEGPGYELLKHIKSCALIPIKIDNKVFGVLTLESQKDNFFTEDDLLVLESFAIQAAIALRNANLFDKLQKSTETFPKISELDTDIDKVLQNIADIAAEVLETDILLLYRWDEEKGKIIWPPISSGKVREPEYMMSEAISSDTPTQVIKIGKFHYTENSKEDPIMTSEGEPLKEGVPARFVFREEIVSSACIILKVGQEKVGVMFINYRTHHKFDEDERKIIENYASYIAIAIQNVKHFSEKQAATRLQTLGQLAAVIAHKIKNDISPISLYTGDLIDETSPKDPHYFNLTQIKEKVRKITSEIDNLLIASEKKIPEKEFVDISRLTNEIEQEIISDLKTKKIEFEKKINADIPEIKVDPTQIRMVLSNLAYNSIEAMPDGGKITISISKSKHTVLLDWKDTGKGISPGVGEKVFQPFWTTKNKGFGLGLFLSKSIIEEHGGTISLDLNYKKGARFIIEFPIEELI